jgi:D-beta-D-heptose 7-phosphate kinase/D-beta-D-heptose 1-phosphate adenosyltransferase
LVLNHEPPVQCKLGGAANVALNAAMLGAQVDLIGMGGEHRYMVQFHAALQRSIRDNPGLQLEYWLACESRRFTVKTRYCAHGKQLLRVDSESSDLLTGEEVAQLYKIYERVVGQPDRPAPDIAILSDYAKGVLSEDVLSSKGRFLRALTIALKRDGIPYVVDPKSPHFSTYGEARVICPNRREYDNAADHGSAEHVVITEGEAGCTIIPRDEDKCQSLAVEPVKLCDPTGAGDTFIAALAVRLARGDDVPAACRFANKAARHAVSVTGTAAVRLSDIEEEEI